MIVNRNHFQHFFNLLKDSEYASEYFLEKNIANQFNNQKLSEIHNQLSEYKDKYYRSTSSSLFPIAMHFKRYKISHKYLISVEQKRQDVIQKDKELEIFESNLAYLIISDKINIEDCKKLNFDDEYLKKLLERFKPQVSKYLTEYKQEISRKTFLNRASQITKDSKCTSLPPISDITNKCVGEENVQTEKTTQTSKSLLDIMDSMIERLDSSDNKCNSNKNKEKCKKKSWHKKSSK